MTALAAAAPNVIQEANWRFHWRLTESAGIMVYLADYKGRRVLWEGSLPYVTVDHQRASVVDETASSYACGPKTSLIAFVSAASPCGVEVPWALMYPTRSGVIPARSIAARIISPTPTEAGSGCAMWCASFEVPYERTSA